MYVQEKFILVNVYITNKMSTFSLYIYIYIIYVRRQADATVAPTCINIYILHGYIFLYVS
jgi:hypothetical protein